jgi:hypothetical protein
LFWRDVLIVSTLFGLCGGREERGRELLGFLEALGHRDPMHRLRLFVFGPRGTWGKERGVKKTRKRVKEWKRGFFICAEWVLTCDVPADDRLERYHLRLPDEDGATVELLRALAHLLQHVLDARSDDVVRDDAFQLVEPEE